MIVLKLFCYLAFVKYSLDVVVLIRAAEHASALEAAAETFVRSNVRIKFPGKAIYPLSFPSMNETGGVLFFYHMQKTGGITVRKAMSRRAKAHVKFVRIPPQSEEFVTQSDMIQRYLQRNTNNTRILFVEHHGGQESILNMTPHFEQWRHASQSTKVPLFIFTLLREPVAHAISHFNFFHVPPGSPPFDHELYEPTEENLKTVATSEHQWRMLANGGEGRSMLHVDFDDEWERTTRHVLQKHFDWIGATEQLNQITLPLLAWLVFGDSQALVRMRAKNVASKRHGVQQLSNQTITLETLTYLESINRRVKRLWAEDVLVS